MKKVSIQLIVMLIGLWLTACQQPYYSSGNVGVKDHSDAVVRIEQVDPAYRKYFTSQHDSNFSLQDQRKAFFEAVKTSKTPVQQDAREMAAANKKKAAAKKTKRTSKKKVVKRKSSSKKSTSKKSSSKSKKKTSSRKKRR